MKNTGTLHNVISESTHQIKSSVFSAKQVSKKATNGGLVSPRPACNVQVRWQR